MQQQGIQKSCSTEAVTYCDEMWCDNRHVKMRGNTNNQRHNRLKADTKTKLTEHTGCSVNTTEGGPPSGGDGAVTWTGASPRHPPRLWGRAMPFRGSTHVAHPSDERGSRRPRQRRRTQSAGVSPQLRLLVPAPTCAPHGAEGQPPPRTAAVPRHT